MITKRKLIEVALPLEAINKAAAKEKSIRHGHPSTIHLWWARRPLAAARAVIFAQMVDDPSAHPDVFPTPKAQEKERQRLFQIIEQLVLWENTNNERVLKAANDEIWQSWRAACAENVDHPQAKLLFDRHRLPGFHDPFAGGGALPLEAQRLGLQSCASDLNPVAVLINRALLDCPARFAGKPPVNQVARSGPTISGSWKGAAGLAADVRYYGQWLRDEAERRIGKLYPQVEITKEMAQGRTDLKTSIGKKLTVVAWIWARTVKSPNPAFAHVDIPLVSSFILSSKAGREAYVEPVVTSGGYHFTVRTGKPKNSTEAAVGTRAGKAQDFLCLMSRSPVPRTYVRDEGKAGRLGSRLMAIVAETAAGRVYLPALEKQETIALNLHTSPVVQDAQAGFLSGSTPTRAMITGGVCSAYGLSTWGHLFTPRQLIALTTFSDLVQEARAKAKQDAEEAGLAKNRPGLAEQGDGADAYADSIAMYLSFAVSKAADRNSALCVWESTMDRLRGTFGRQAIPMVWDYVETNPLAGAGGDIYGTVQSLCEVLDKSVAAAPGTVSRQDARAQELSQGRVVSTDPPYYDNIGYADLSDFFYVWLRRSLKAVFPDLFQTMAAPKAEELVATLYRHGTKEKAEAFFLDGMTQAMQKIAEQAHPAFPVTIYYAFKQSESSADEGTVSTGWDTFLDAVIKAGFGITGTWPMRSELATRSVGRGANALASSIVLVCRKRSGTTNTATRREFIAALRAELPGALAHLQKGNIAPVDLAQASIGPGMAIFTGFGAVLDADGKPLLVREALALINQTLDEALAEQEGDFDADTRWALTWFEQSGFSIGEYGIAERLSTAKNTSVSGLVEAGIIESGRGKVRLLKPSELPSDWDPTSDMRLTVWETVHHLIRTLDAGGELGAAALVAKLGANADVARELAYRLYTLCERKKRAAEALAYNALVQSWPEITRLAREAKTQTRAAQGGLFDRTEG